MTKKEDMSEPTHVQINTSGALIKFKSYERYRQIYVAILKKMNIKIIIMSH